MSDKTSAEAMAAARKVCVDDAARTGVSAEDVDYFDSDLIRDIARAIEAALEERDETIRTLCEEHDRFVERLPYHPTDRVVGILARVAELEEVGTTVNVVFDGPPSHESGRFVEVETLDGRSVNAGKWIEGPDGLWYLQLQLVALQGDRDE